LKGLLIAFIRERTRTKDTGDIDTIHEHESTKGLFSPDVLTIGFARRVSSEADYDFFGGVPLVPGLDRVDNRLSNGDADPMGAIFVEPGELRQSVAHQLDDVEQVIGAAEREANYMSRVGHQGEESLT